MNKQVEIIMPGDDVDIIEIIQGNVIFGSKKWIMKNAITHINGGTKWIV